MNAFFEPRPMLLLVHVLNNARVRVCCTQVNIASVAMLLNGVAMLLADPHADLPYGLQTRLLPEDFLNHAVASQSQKSTSRP